MCLILFEWAPERPHGRRLCVAANRDEFRHRVAEPLKRWPGAHGIMAGIDRGAPPSPDGLPGTWMGVTVTGRFAALTNFRDPRERQSNTASRGVLVSRFLGTSVPCAEYLLGVQAQQGRFNGFNLLVGDILGPDPQLWWFSNRANHAAVKLQPGLYGLSNALLDTPWPKVREGVGAFCLRLAAGGDVDALFGVLADETLAPDHDLPATGIALVRERQLSARFIRGDDYGTRASQVLTVNGLGEIDYRERRYEADLPAHLGIETRLQQCAML